MLATIDVETITMQGIEIPIAAALDQDGRPAPLIGDVAPENCDHAGVAWSDCLDLRCPRCGAPMFLPARFLAYVDGETLDIMHQLWQTAGCPPWTGSGWGIVPEYWKIVHMSAFGEVGGLPVRRDRWPAFTALRQATLLELEAA